MVRVALGGKGSAIRHTGVRLHTELGEAGEAVLVELLGAEWIGGRRYASWRGQPPVDLVDHKTNIAYQSKVITDIKAGDIAFSGAHRLISGRNPSGHGMVYYGEPEDKLVDIRQWVEAHGWTAWKIVFLLDETGNRATVYSKRGVTNAGIKSTRTEDSDEYLSPIASYDNDTGEWRRIPGTPDSDYPPGMPNETILYSRFPRIPEYLRSDISEVQARQQLLAMGIFRRPDVHVRRHRRRGN